MEDQQAALAAAVPQGAEVQAAAAAPAAGDQGEQQPREQAPAAAAPQAAAAPPAPDFAYSPADQCDLIIKTADGMRIGVHRLIVLRVAGFFKELLDACAESEVGAHGACNVCC